MLNETAWAIAGLLCIVLGLLYIGSLLVQDWHDDKDLEVFFEDKEDEKEGE